MAWVGVTIFKYMLHIKNIDKAASRHANDNAVKTKEQSKPKTPPKTDYCGQAKKIAEAKVGEFFSWSPHAILWADNANQEIQPRLDR